MAAVTICSDFGAPQNKVCHCFHCFLSICHEVIRPDAMILVFWMLSFKPAFSLSSFTFIKRLFSSSSLSATRVVSSAYLRLLVFLPAVLIPAFASSSPAFQGYQDCTESWRLQKILLWVKYISLLPWKSKIVSEVKSFQHFLCYKDERSSDNSLCK